MQVIKIDQDSPEWMDLRLGRITGSKLDGLVQKRSSKFKKDGFYQLIADRLAIEDEIDEDARDRGHRLEQEAIEQVKDQLGKNLDIDIKPGVWVSDIDENIILSPDGGIKNEEGEYTRAIEVKCFDAKNHLRAIVENRVPIKYWLQVIQYFIVNEILETLYVVFYDPRIKVRPLHVITIERDDVEKEVEEYKQYEIDLLKEIDEIIESLTF